VEGGSYADDHLMLHLTSSDEVGSDAMVPVLHIHAQQFWHGDAQIIGNRVALEALKSAIERALANGEADAGEMYVADGEGYTVCVRLRDVPIADALWHEALLPYGDEIASGDRTRAV
jgi:hypothetical protein